MKIRSFIRGEMGLAPVQVEVALVPGLSQIQILGMADSVIKESSKRILSSLRYQGFRMPPGRQVLVNLEPNHLRKHSQGLDLAIALGILIESEQLSTDFFDLEKGYVYGSLGLKGEVIVPEDLKLLNYENFERALLTGLTHEPFRFATYQCQGLSTLMNLSFVAGDNSSFTCAPLPLKAEIDFPENLARLMGVVAVGEHPLLLAGAAGCGKSTCVENLPSLLGPPQEKTYLQAQKIWKLSGRDLSTRPLANPHHSVTPVAMVGGGVPLKAGEITLAHSGTLILDELLEFHPKVQSALREPMESGHIFLARGGRRQKLPAQVLILATTNLCPCGGFQPGAPQRCRCSSLKLRNYVERLTGPFLDRFAIFHIYKKAEQKKLSRVSLQDLKKQVEQAQNFAKEQRGQVTCNHSLGEKVLLGQLSTEVRDLLPVSESQRRRLALLRVARSLADLEASKWIKSQHIEEAQEWTARDIYRLQRFSIDDFLA